MAENVLISDAVSHCVRGYWAVTHALRRQPQPTDSAAGGARVWQALATCKLERYCASPTSLDAQHVNEVHVTVPTVHPTGYVLQVSVLPGRTTDDYSSHIQQATNNVCQTSS